MDEQTSEKRRSPAWGRLLLISVVALLVAGTGIVLLPRDSGTPPTVSFSVSALADAFADTRKLQESAAGLMAAAGSGSQTAALDDAVTLLTTQSRALLPPSPAASTTSDKKDTATEATPASVVAGLIASGRQRLDDACEADGGTARLLAAVGSAQLLQGEKLAAAWQVPVPLPTSSGNPSATTPAVTTPAPHQCPSVSPTPDATAATTDAALAATVRSEQEAIYVYQVALKRLDAGATAQAAKYLAVHERLLQQAEALTRRNCGDVPTREAGYRLPAQFAEDPAAGLGALESDSLQGFGDLIALSTGETRDWAASSLLAAVRRSLDWGATLAALPGLEVDDDDLPPLPTPTPQ
ncbi:DUF4439 domain-containing protein [Arthrobacter sp. StoSoilB13]|uniref:DUF4439 domain-containing protein n=1 Tax=Arthrobacter sp. StoSoilB13 TaxID=2830993 RepID=UPI001CC4FFAB|nr:DUF4439 domain-containing protein [Arthrobacter sp. StoSoilB13]BCW51525.1 hypothetical protein StoSoilB13_38670 [Arthrobacter sp. StoSoilB13]